MVVFYFDAKPFSFPTFLELGSPNYVSSKLVYQLQISSRLAPESYCFQTIYGKYCYHIETDQMI